MLGARDYMLPSRSNGTHLKALLLQHKHGGYQEISLGAEPGNPAGEEEVARGGLCEEAAKRDDR